MLAAPRRQVAVEIRKVVARLGGHPEVHGVAAPEVVVTRLGEDAERVVHAVPTQIDRVVIDAPLLGAGVEGLTIPPLEAEVDAALRPLEAIAHYAEPPPAITPSHRVPAIEPGAAQTVAHRVAAPDTHTVHYDVDRVDLHGVARPTAVRRHEPSLPRRAGVRRYRTLPRSLFLLHRTRVPWEAVGRTHLATGWTALLREHAVVIDDLTPIGMYGPMRMGLVAGARVTGDGRLAVELRPKPIPGPRGDIFVALHRPTGRVLRSASARATRRR